MALITQQQYLESIKKAGFKDVQILSDVAYDIDISRELNGKITSVHVEAYKK